MKMWRVDWLPVLAIAVGAIMGVTVFDTVEDFVEGDFDDDDVRKVVIEAPTPEAEATFSPDGRWVALRSQRKTSAVRPQPSGTPGWGRVSRDAPKLTLTKTDGPARVVRIRGTKRVESDPAPLVYVDGVRVEPGGGIDDIEPSSIDRIEIVKGGAAVDLYGTEGAGGVIQIFLKKKVPTGSR